MSDNLIMINVRYGNGTYIARAKGMNKTASATSCAKDAVEKLIQKIAAGKKYIAFADKNGQWQLTLLDS